jgi:succinate-acetate transporter protein
MVQNREMAVGNTFGATALSSYGGFWLSFAIVLTPGGFDIVSSYSSPGGDPNAFNNAFGFFLAGWFIFTFLLLICTLRSTVAFFLLFFFLDLTFLFLAVAHLQSKAGVAHSGLTKAGGYFGIFSAFMAWYNALAGIADDRFVFLLPSLCVVGFRDLKKEKSKKVEKIKNQKSRANVGCVQQFLLRHPRRAFPMVDQGPQAPRRRAPKIGEGYCLVPPFGAPLVRVLLRAFLIRCGATL